MIVPVTLFVGSVYLELLVIVLSAQKGLRKQFGAVLGC